MEWRKAIRLVVVGTVMTSVVIGPLRPVYAAVDQRELRAREAFAVGHYQEALELFAKLYAEKLHPNYLRNIGRCYQNLGDPDQAITSFRDYLRKARALPADERAEVEGYIKEMEELKVKRQNGAAVDPSRGGAVATAGSANGSGMSLVAPQSVPIATAPPAPAPAPAPAPGADLTAAPGPTADPEHPVYQRWWFWAIIGGAAALGLGVAAATGTFTKTEDAKCPGGNTQC